jgi:hypothetical protein
LDIVIVDSPTIEDVTVNLLELSEVAEHEHKILADAKFASVNYPGKSMMTTAPEGIEWFVGVIVSNVILHTTYSSLRTELTAVVKSIVFARLLLVVVLQL